MNTTRFFNSPNVPLWGWCLFDFTNSIPAIIGGIYFSKWYTEDLGAGSVIFNCIFFLSSLIILFTGKWVGRQIDLVGYKYWIKISYVVCFLSILSLFLGSQYFTKAILVYLSFVFFLIFLFSYQIGRICHNVYLRNVIPFELQSKMSGLGTAANWVGSLLGILLTIPVVSLYPNMLGREYTFLIAAISYGVLIPVSLSLMFRLGDSNVQRKVVTSEIINFKQLLRSLGFLLLIYLLLFDVMATVQRNLPPYLSIVSKMPDTIQNFGFLVILLSAVIGGVLASKFVRFSNSARALKTGTFILAIAILLIIIPSSITLWLAFVLAGISYGMLESAMRISFMNLFPKEKSGESFGILAVVERMSGVVGPVLWIIPFSLIKSVDSAYIAAMLLMALLTILSFIALFMLRFKKIEFK